MGDTNSAIFQESVSVADVILIEICLTLKTTTDYVTISVVQQ